MYYVYVLRSLKDHRRYIGLTNDLSRRIKEHNSGKVSSTSSRKPLELIYFEEFADSKLAEKRERYLKSGKGYEALRYLLEKSSS